MIKVRRIGHVTFSTPDLDRQIDYYRDIVGLSVVSRDANRACLASRMGLLTIVLEKATQQSCDRIAFEVAPDTDITDITKRLAGHGIEAKSCTDPLPGVSRLVTFSDVKGTTIELFSGLQFVDVPAMPGGVGAYKLGHIAFYHPNPQQVAEFYTKVMGFKVSDWIGDYFVFMRCGVDHHTVNFLRGDLIAMQHMAFELNDRAHQLAACDLLGQRKIDILWGPVRHGPGHNLATYHRNPDDQIIELFCDLDRMADEDLEYFEPRPWHRNRPQKPMVWDPSQPRDIWGPAPHPEFRRPAGSPKE